MEESLKHESAKLAESWLRHDAEMLRGYLVSGVEDPRLNLQSVLSRHFLLRAIAGERFSALMDQECRFAAAMNWLTNLAGGLQDAEELKLVGYALKRGADNAEGIEIPAFIVQLFAALPTVSAGLTVPNYIESFLAGTEFAGSHAKLHEPSLNAFRDLWHEALAAEATLIGAPTSSRLSAPQHLGQPPLPGSGLSRLQVGAPSVLEPACGSANDYRFLDAYGVARLVNYSGFDLCAKNIENAHALFPDTAFAVGNVFEIPAQDKTFDLCFVHDLFEHLSLEGMQVAVREVCRVTRGGLCIGFFNMDEIGEHQVRPVEEYHWNLLSMGRMRELFAECGFAAQVVHIGTFLRQQVGCEQTHNPNAYTFLLRPA